MPYNLRSVKGLNGPYQGLIYAYQGLISMGHEKEFKAAIAAFKAL